MQSNAGSTPKTRRLSLPARVKLPNGMRRALEEFVIEGVQTTIPLHQEIISQQEYIDGMYNIHWLEHYMKAKQEKKQTS